MEEQVKKVSWWRSLQVKYAMTYVAVIAAVLVLVNSYPVTVSQDLTFQSKQAALQSQALVISSALAAPDGLTPEGVGRVMEVLGNTGLTRVLVTDASGMVLYDSLPGAPALGRYALLSEVAAALGGNDVGRCDFLDGAFRSRSAVPVTYRGMTLGAVYVDEVDVEQGQMLLRMQRTLRSISLVIAAIALALSVFFSKALTHRIAQLLSAVRTVRQGEYDHRLQVSGRDELSQLAGEFNDLTDRLQATEEVRRRFVSDASHELKTPLASIRLLTDSILQTENMDPDTVQEFVGDIGDEADRLQRITQDLLSLTRLDAQAQAETRPVDVTAVIGRAHHMLRPLAQAAGVEIALDLAPGLVVEATEDDLYQIVFNLMENAVKYNLPGGTLTVSTRAREGRALILVEDTGVGIPQEDMDKIFDRFYRVDKARSRAAGGTGLGLSIALDTARRYGGTIHAQRREEGEGTLFTVSLPLPCPEGREEGTA